MATIYDDAYRLRPRDAGSAAQLVERLNGILQSLDSRIGLTEERSASVAELEDALRAYGTDRINATLAPVLAAITAAADLGGILTTTSATSLTVGLGAHELTIPAPARLAFAPTAHLSIVSASDAGVAMLARRAGWNRTTGLLTVDVIDATGAGVHSDWIVSAASVALTSNLVSTGAAGELTGATLAQQLEEVADALAARQAAAVNLSALAALSLVGDRLLSTNSEGALALQPLTALARTLLAAADAGAMRDAISAAARTSPVFEGTPTVPTPAIDAPSLQIANVTALLQAIAAVRGAANGVAGLGSDGKILDAQLPALAISDTFEVASQAAMLALTAERGDVAVRSDLSKSFVLKATPASTLANWVELKTPTDAVLSVAGRTGAITLTAADLSDATAVGRALLAAVSVAAQRTALGLVIGQDVQAYSPTLAAIAALTTTAYGRGLLSLADQAALRAEAAPVASLSLDDNGADQDTLTTLNARRRGASYNNAGVVLGAPRSDTADGAQRTGRGAVLLPGRSDGTSAGLLLMAATLGIDPTADYATLRAYQSVAEVDSNGILYLWFNGTRYAQFGAAVDNFVMGKFGVKTSTPAADLDVNGTLRVNNGATLQRLLTATASLDFPSIAAAGSATLTITVTGAAINDSVSLGLPSAPTAGIVYAAYVSAANTVTVRATNITGAAIDPAAATFRVTVIGF